jgi:hypothetical protein
VLTDAREGLAARNIEVRPKGNGWMSLWYKGKRFANLGAKKKFFVAQIITLEETTLEETWSGRQRITTREEWNAFCEQFMEPVLRQLELGK